MLHRGRAPPPLAAAAAAAAAFAAKHTPNMYMWVVERCCFCFSIIVMAAAQATAVSRVQSWRKRFRRTS